jgi:hypothetical protein
LNYDQTFAAIVKPALYRAIFFLAAIHVWEIEQLDMKMAFLYGNIDTEVYVEQPHRFKLGDKFCRLNRSLYRLKQSPRL